MSKISHHSFYDSLPSVFLMNSDMELMWLCHYEYDTVDRNYVGKQFFNAKTEELEFDDRELTGKEAAVFQYQHTMLGYKYDLKLDRGHPHITYLISSNDIKADDVYTKCDNGDIIYFANLINKVVRNGGEFILAEVEPHLTSKELKNLRENTTSVMKWKNTLINETRKRKKAEASAFIHMCHATASDAVVQQNEITIKSLMNQGQNLLTALTQVKIETTDKIASAVENMEEHVDANLDWGAQELDMVNKAITEGKMRYNFADRAGSFNSNSVTAETKKNIAQQAINACGKEYLMAALNDYEGNSGLPTSLPEAQIKIDEMERTGMIPQGNAEYYKDILREQVMQRMNDNPNLTPESIIQDMFADLLPKINGGNRLPSPSPMMSKPNYSMRNIIGKITGR